MKYLVVLLCLVACALAADNFKECRSKKGFPAKVKAVKVDDKETCDLKKNTTSTIQIDFDMTDKVDGNVTVKVSASFLTLPLNDPDGWKTGGGGLKCPLEKDKSYTYKNEVKVPSFNYQGDVSVKWTFMTQVDGKSKDILCIQVPCSIA